MQTVLEKLEKLTRDFEEARSQGESGLPRFQRQLEEFERQIREAQVPSDPDPEERLQIMQQRARHLGHDFNNCLGIVSGRAELISIYLGKGNLKAAQKGIDVILRQMDRMKELTDALRNLRHDVWTDRRDRT